MEKVKCKECGKQIDKSEAIQISERGYCCCNECAELYKDKKITKKNYKSIKGSAREKCTDYIQSLYMEQGYSKGSINWALIGSQLSNLLKENITWKYSTIKYTLWYMKEIKEMNLFDASQGSILNLVPFYVEEAKEYYYQTMEIKKELENFDFSEETKVVIRKSKSKPTKPRWVEEVDITELI